MQIREFQKLMHNLYYKRDKERGLHRTFMWLVEEMGELSKSINRKSINENLENISEEFADVFAWLCSLANIIGLDLQDVSLRKYNNLCPKCREKPCMCELI